MSNRYNRINLTLKIFRQGHGSRYIFITANTLFHKYHQTEREYSDTRGNYLFKKIQVIHTSTYERREGDIEMSGD